SVPCRCLLLPQDEVHDPAAPGRADRRRGGVPRGRCCRSRCPPGRRLEVVQVVVPFVEDHSPLEPDDELFAVQFGRRPPIEYVARTTGTPPWYWGTPFTSVPGPRIASTAARVIPTCTRRPAASRRLGWATQRAAKKT